MSWPNSLLMIQAYSCIFLCGLIWTIQLVHYPSFQWVDVERFRDFEQFHQAKISYIVLPMMILELVTACLLLVYVPKIIPTPFLWINLIGLGCIWLSTFLLSVPLHNELSQGANSTAMQNLVFTNWPRTILWSLRSFGWAWFLLKGV